MFRSIPPTATFLVAASACIGTAAAAGLEILPLDTPPGSLAPDVAAAPGSDSAVATWLEPDGNGHRLRLAGFDRKGALLGERTLARLTGGRVSGFPRLARLERGLRAVWTESVSGYDGKPTGRVASGWLPIAVDPPAG